jgi:hypothetical protein
MLCYSWNVFVFVFWRVCITFNSNVTVTLSEMSDMLLAMAYRTLINAVLDFHFVFFFNYCAECRTRFVIQLVML